MPFELPCEVYGGWISRRGYNNRPAAGIKKLLWNGRSAAGVERVQEVVNSNIFQEKGASAWPMYIAKP